MKIEFSLALVYSAQRPGSHPLRWQGSGSFAVTLCLQVSCQLGQGREPVPSESNAAGLRGAGDLQVHENLLSLGREVAARSKLPHVRRGLFWVQGSCSPEGHGGIPLLFCGSNGRVVIAEVNLDAPGGLQDTWPPRVILPPPPCARISLGPGRAGQRETWTLDLEHLVGWGSCTSRACVWGGSPTYLTVPSFMLRFSKTTFLRYFLCYKICKLEVVSSVFAKLCNHHHSLILECLNSPRRNQAHHRLPPVPSSPQPQATLFPLWIHQFWDVHINGIIP